MFAILLKNGSILDYRLPLGPALCARTPKTAEMVYQKRVSSELAGG